VFRDTVVVIATYFKMDGAWVESLWGTKLSVPIQTGCGPHPPSCAMGSGSLTLG